MQENTQQLAETMDDFKDMIDASFRKIKEGDIITGTIIDINEEFVTVDLKYYAPGIIKFEELSDDPNYNICDNLHIGDSISATVISEDDNEGNILLSLKDAKKETAWDTIYMYYNNNTTVTVRISEEVNSGVIAFLEGIRAFIPASQLTTAYVEDLEAWVGKAIEVKVITVDKFNNKLVLSGKEIALAKAESEKSNKISKIIPGTVVEGTVDSLMPYGAFVNLEDGLSGLIHISQICEKRIKKPSEILSIGQKVKVKILNTNDNKISLSMKALSEETQTTTLENDFDYKEDGTASTSLADLLSKFKL